MEERREIRFFKIDDVRQATVADSFYAIKGKDDLTTKLAITDVDGNVFFTADSNSTPSVMNHNLLLNLQGGKIPNEFFHLSSSQYTRVLDLLYTENETSIRVEPSFGERGVVTNLNLTYNIVSNDDEIISASINNGIGEVLSEVNTGVKTVSLGSFKVSKTYTLTITFKRKGQTMTQNFTSTYDAFIPQFAGVSENVDFSNYATMSSQLSKYVQASANISKITSPTDKYIWFISNKPSATVLDQNNFLQTVGIWGNNLTEFWTKPITITLADGVTTSTVYLYRSRNKKTLISFGYKIQ